MGKSKKRILNKISDKNTVTMKRQDAIDEIVLHIKSKKTDINTKNIISLFGIKPEELTESGISFEELSAVKNLFL